MRGGIPHHRSGQGGTPFQVWMVEGYPIPGLDEGYPIPGLDGGYPIPGLDGGGGGTLGTPLARSRWWKGVTPRPDLDGVGLPRVPPWPGLDGGGYPLAMSIWWGLPGSPPTRTEWGTTPTPIRQSSIASTYYPVGGMPLAFTQQDFLVDLLFIKCH